VNDNQKPSQSEPLPIQLNLRKQFTTLKRNAPLKIGAWINLLLYNLQLRKRKKPAGYPTPIGIYKSDSLGDFVLALGSIRAILDNYGEKNCILLTSPASTVFAREQFPNTQQIVTPPFSGRLWKTWKAINHLQKNLAINNGFDKLICLRHHRYLHQELVFNSIPSKTTYGVQNSPCGFSGEIIAGKLRFDLEVEYPKSARPGWCLDLESHANLLTQVLGAEVNRIDVTPTIDISEPSLVEPWIAVALFGAHRIRNLPLNLIREVGCHFATNYSLGIRLIASPSQIEEIKSAAKTLIAIGIPKIEIVRTNSISELINTIKRSSVLLTTETATAHLAIAVDAKVVGILGGGHFSHFAPWNRSNRQRWIYSKIECYACNWICPHEEALCITRIDPQRVIKEISEVIKL